MGERRPSRQQPRRGLLNRWRLLWAGLMALVLGISIIGSVMAQPLVLNSAPIVLDGRPLFEVAPANQMTADERAEQISGDLEDLLEEDDGLNVSTEVRNKAPVILIDGSYLMTVTQNDADLNDADSPEELAPVWAEQLDQELEIAQTERSNAVLQRRLVYSLGLIALTLLAHRLIGYLWRRSLRPLLENLADRKSVV